jgi:hypothetical protein
MRDHSVTIRVMKFTLFAILGALSLPLLTSTASAHERSRDRVTRVDRYDDANVIHYDHHHRRYYFDDCGRLRERTYHHDHHYVMHHDHDRRRSFRWLFSR